MPKEYTYGYWNDSDETWEMTDSGKFTLTVWYGGRQFTAKFKDQGKCRTDIQGRISKAISLGILEAA